MAMTAKHYKLVASVFVGYYPNAISQHLLKTIIVDLADTFSANDSKFNKDKFLKECGL